MALSVEKRRENGGKERRHRGRAWDDRKEERRKAKGFAALRLRLSFSFPSVPPRPPPPPPHHFQFSLPRLYSLNVHLPRLCSPYFDCPKEYERSLCGGERYQPSAQAFPSRSLDLAQNFMTSPNGLQRATKTGSQALARTLCSPVRGRERLRTRPERYY